jgi:hypothetical protein
VKYEVISDQPCLIDAIGEMVPGEPVLLSSEEAKLFKDVHGYQLAESKFPDYVTVTVILSEE